MDNVLSTCAGAAGSELSVDIILLKTDGINNGDTALNAYCALLSLESAPGCGIQR